MYERSQFEEQKKGARAARRSKGRKVTEVMSMVPEVTNRSEWQSQHRFPVCHDERDRCRIYNNSTRLYGTRDNLVTLYNDLGIFPALILDDKQH